MSSTPARIDPLPRLQPPHPIENPSVRAASPVVVRTRSPTPVLNHPMFARAPRTVRSRRSPKVARRSPAPASSASGARHRSPAPGRSSRSPAPGTSRPSPGPPSVFAGRPVRGIPGASRRVSTSPAPTQTQASMPVYPPRGGRTLSVTYASSPRVESIPAAPVAIPRVDTSHFVLVKFASAHVPPSGHISEPAAHAAARALHALSTPPAGSIASLINATNVTPGPVAPPPQPGPPAGEPALIAQLPQQKAFACHWEGCTRSFDRRYNLKVHFRRHTNETPYPCKAAGCEERFKWRSSLAHHMRTRHPEEVAAGAGVEAGRRGNGKRKREEAVPAADSPLTEENAEAGGGASAATE